MSDKTTQLIFPSASGSCLKALQMLGDKDTDINTLQEVIAGDELLANAVIKYSNSPIHHRETELEELTPAINILGLKNVYIVLIMAVLKEYMKDSLTGTRILQHSVTISALASFIAINGHKSAQYEVELLGVLHDLPSLVLCHNFKTEYRALLKGINTAKQPLEELEQELFGTNRQKLMDLSMRELFMPDQVRNTLIDYHGITDAEQAEKNEYLAILSLAHHMETSLVPEKLRLHDSIPGERRRLQENLGISDDDYSRLINQSRDVINEHIVLVA